MIGNLSASILLGNILNIYKSNENIYLVSHNKKIY
jgi:hypothetical protein